jgi:AraC-like DNA-binding protein
MACLQYEFQENCKKHTGSSENRYVTIGRMEDSRINTSPTENDDWNGEEGNGGEINWRYDRIFSVTYNSKDKYASNVGFLHL